LVQPWVQESKSWETLAKTKVVDESDDGRESGSSTAGSSNTRERLETDNDLIEIWLLLQYRGGRFARDFSTYHEVASQSGDVRVSTSGGVVVSRSGELLSVGKVVGDGGFLKKERQFSQGLSEMSQFKIVLDKRDERSSC